MKVIVGAFNQELVLVGTFSVIMKSSGTFGFPLFEALMGILKLAPCRKHLLQGVPYHWAHFVFVIFSGSRAHTEELLILIPKLTLLSILCEKLTKLQHKT